MCRGEVTFSSLYYLKKSWKFCSGSSDSIKATLWRDFDLQTKSIVVKWVEVWRRPSLLTVILCIVHERLGWSQLKLWRLSDMFVGCCHSCQMCEVLLLLPSCRECCLASGTLIVWLWSLIKADWWPFHHQKLQQSYILFSFKPALMANLYYCVWNI